MLKRAQESQLHDHLTPEEYKSVVSGYRHNFPSGIPECGTDGLRFSLLSHDIQSKVVHDVIFNVFMLIFFFIVDLNFSFSLK